jgi:hypothetical protein
VENKKELLNDLRGPNRKSTNLKTVAIGMAPARGPDMTSLKTMLLSTLVLAMTACGPGPAGGTTRGGLLGGTGSTACIEIAVQCPAGEEPADVDGDGCALECRATGPACIEIAVQCPAGQEPADVDGDGCALECRATGPVCIAIAVECPAGQVATDVDGDGCALECAAQ